MNETTFYIGGLKWEQSLSNIKELVGDSKLSETKIRNLLAFDIPALLTKFVNTINPDLPVVNCLPTLNNRVVVKFPEVITETDIATIKAIILKTLQLSEQLTLFNPEISYIINREFKDGVMLITLNKEIK